MSNLTHSHGKNLDAMVSLEESLQALTEALTGIAASNKRDWALSIGYLLQRFRGGHFLKQLAEEFKMYREKGSIREDYAKSDQCLTCLQEILDCIDKDSPDEVRFNHMKNLFLGIAFEVLSKRDDIVPAQLVRICRALSSKELLLLAANYRLCRKGEWQQHRAQSLRGREGLTSNWIVECKAESGLKFDELVLEGEVGLQGKRLLGESVYNDRSAFLYTEHYRLTALGYHLCEFIHAPSQQGT